MNIIKKILKERKELREKCKNVKFRVEKCDNYCKFDIDGDLYQESNFGYLKYVISAIEVEGDVFTESLIRVLSIKVRIEHRDDPEYIRGVCISKYRETIKENNKITREMEKNKNRVKEGDIL